MWTPQSHRCHFKFAETLVGVQLQEERRIGEFACLESLDPSFQREFGEFSNFIYTWGHGHYISTFLYVKQRNITQPFSSISIKSDFKILHCLSQYISVIVSHIEVVSLL